MQYNTFDFKMGWGGIFQSTSGSPTGRCYSGNQFSRWSGVGRWGDHPARRQREYEAVRGGGGVEGSDLGDVGGGRRLARLSIDWNERD